MTRTRYVIAAAAVLVTGTAIAAAAASAPAAALSQQDVPGNIAKGRRNWPAVLVR